MKKVVIFLFALVVSLAGMAQPYFKATMQKSSNRLIFKIMPVGGDITNKRFSAIEFFVRYPTSSPAFTFGTPTVDPAFSGMAFIPKGPNLYGSETGYINYVFEWIGGATFVPAAPTTYTNNTEYTVFSVDLIGPTNVTDMEFVHNTNQSPTYINISDNSGNSLSCLDNFGSTIGDAFYGPGFNIGASSAGGNDHILPLSAVPIPVKFLSFSVAKSNNDALLKWEVANEDANTDRYELERSLNGTDFTTFATVAKNAGSSTTNNYASADADIAGRISNNGIVYYRVKQIDKDGRFVYTDIKNLRFNGSKEISVNVFPNPVRDFATVNIDVAAAASVFIFVTDATGKEMQKITMDAVAGLNSKKVNMTGWAAGTYQFKVRAGEETKVISVVKK